MVSLIHRANERGGADLGWLKTRYSFSFADYYSKYRMGFGRLRVLNDDVIQGGGGFGQHPHQDMEIITIMLDGALEHQDSTGNVMKLVRDEVQVMSAGRGVYHSEVNASAHDPVSLFQLWIQPRVNAVVPRYRQAHFSTKKQNNCWQLLVSPRPVDDAGLVVTEKDVVGPDNIALQIFQDARIYRGQFEAGKLNTLEFSRSERYGLFLLVISGKVDWRGEVLGHRDSAEISALLPDEDLQFQALESSDLLLIEVPLQ
jgi:hypothetical protein